jgi:thiol-disulfide isomerase/thioredoxin
MSVKQVVGLFISVLYSSWSLAHGGVLLEQAARTQGFFFFYSSSCPHCQRFAPQLKQFSEHYGFKVVAISVDGGYLPSFPNAVMDNGQKHSFGVTLLPSLFLVDPARQRSALVTEGAVSTEELTTRLLKILILQHKEANNE